MDGTVNATLTGAVNASVNATVNATGTTVVGWTTDIFLPTLLDRLSLLIGAPLRHPEMVYIITPMLITLVMMEFYFGRYTDEELGWNTAVGNALVLIFVAVDLLKTIYPGIGPQEVAAKAWYNITHFTSQSGEAMSTLITGAIFGFGFLLLFTDFFHILPKGFAFFISGSLPINITAYLGIVIVYTHTAGTGTVPFDLYTLLAAILIFLGLWVFFGIVHFIEPKKRDRRDWERLADKRRRIMDERIVDEAPAPESRDDDFP